MSRPRIGLTVGDPSGIGPEIAAKAVANPRVLEVCQPILYGPSHATVHRDFSPGVGSAEGGRVAYEAVTQATADAMAGRLDGLTTAPINKATWDLAGVSWRGHTDLLAYLTGATRVAMMFYAKQLRVVLATAHVPLVDVSRALTADRLDQTLELTHEALPQFGFPNPRIALAGLNPHAGEQGLLGKEELSVFRTVVDACRNRGIDVVGPVSADTLFVRAIKGEFDVVVACYHDQGLIPIKLVAFGSAVNVTLGLPIVRTSVDHGTAYDIAGKGIANPESLIEATCLAARLAENRTAMNHG